MWGIVSTVFLGLYCLMGFYIGRRSWTFLGGVIPQSGRKWFWLLLGMLVFAFPAAEIGEDFLPEAAGHWLTIWGGYSVVAVACIFLMLLFIDFIRLLDKGIGFIPAGLRANSKTAPVLGAAVLTMVAAILIYSTWNARNPIVTAYELEIEKKAGPLGQLRIAMVSDIHYGAIVDSRRLDGMVKTINELQPDIIVLAGDIMEGNLEPVQVRELADILGQLEAKYGKFAVPGNHDRALRGDSLALSYFTEAGIEVLRDNYTKVGDLFYILGRDNPGHWVNRVNRANRVNRVNRAGKI